MIVNSILNHREDHLDSYNFNLDGQDVQIEVSTEATSTTETYNIVSFSLDDDFSEYGAYQGIGAEDPFGLSGMVIGWAPSPSLPYEGPDLDDSADKAVLAPRIPPNQEAVLQIKGPKGYTMGSLSSNHYHELANNNYFNVPLVIDFSLDRNSFPDYPGATRDQSSLNQHPGDIFESPSTFKNPHGQYFSGGPGYSGYYGWLSSSNLSRFYGNDLLIDEGLGTGNGPVPQGLGLQAGEGIILDSTSQGPDPGHNTHDNVDAFDFAGLDLDNDGVLDNEFYFTCYPVDPDYGGGANIYELYEGGFAADLYASAESMGLDSVNDSIDALVVFDGFEPGRLDPGVDFALFSLAPGSETLEDVKDTAGPSESGGPSDIFLTFFEGSFATYAISEELGLDRGGGGSDWAPEIPNIYALEVRYTPNFATILDNRQLRLNMGPQANMRTVNRDYIHEEYVITNDVPYQPYSGGNKVKVSAFGIQEYHADVSSIFADAGEGNDEIIIEADIATNLDGGDGNDVIEVRNNKSDTIIGDLGNDKLYGYGGRDHFNGGDGEDSIYGGNDNDAMRGGKNKDLLIGGFGSDRILGDSGDDLLRGGPNRDIMYGGRGRDKFEFNLFLPNDSIVSDPDRIGDFKQPEGDRFIVSDVLPFKPDALFNAGFVGGNDLSAAVTAAYEKVDLDAYEAVFFTFGSRTYLSVNNSASVFQPCCDLVVDVSRITFAEGDIIVQPEDPYKELEVDKYFL